ncbi:MAG: ferritin-like domain-containing protein [Planctomycetota bacterium]|jgi:bacterioferritin
MTTQAEIVASLTKAYWMEIETVQNYIANSTNLDGVRAEEIKTSLAADVTEEISHAQNFAKRIKELDGRVPGSIEFKPEQIDLQPPADSTDVVSVIKGVIAAEEGAMAHYRKLIKLAEAADDYVTADLATTVLADEEGHRRQFAGFLKEYQR